MPAPIMRSRYVVKTLRHIGPCQIGRAGFAVLMPGNSSCAFGGRVGIMDWSHSAFRHCHRPTVSVILAGLRWIGRSHSLR